MKKVTNKTIYCILTVVSLLFAMYLYIGYSVEYFDDKQYNQNMPGDSVSLLTVLLPPVLLGISLIFNMLGKFKKLCLILKYIVGLFTTLGAIYFVYDLVVRYVFYVNRMPETYRFAIIFKFLCMFAVAIACFLPIKLVRVRKTVVCFGITLLLLAVIFMPSDILTKVFFFCPYAIIFIFGLYPFSNMQSENNCQTKKKIVVWLFCLLIIITAIAFVTMAAYSYETNRGRTFGALEAVSVIFIGGYIVLYELDLFYTVYYFVVKPKTITKTVLNILANVSLGFMFSYNWLSDFFINLRKYEITSSFLLLIYIILRLASFVVLSRSSKQEITANKKHL